ncbi:MAG: helix-turn-helix domain-containing protein [Patescibacteria group bacterium]
MSPVELFKALGEPTRLEMVERLSNYGSQTLTSLFKGMHITRQGARKHLQILADSKIIILLPDGRNTIVQLDQHAFDVGKKFIAKLELRWDKRLEALKNFVEKK